MSAFDPTYVAVDVYGEDRDPRVQRMRGVATHGNTPFDVPFISHVKGNLWQGGCQNGLVLPADIKHVISLYKWEQYKVPHDLDSTLTVTMYDSADAPMDESQLWTLATWVSVCMNSGPTLVHCQAGLNRSGLLAALALIVHYGMDGPDARQLVRDARSPAVLCNPTFAAYLDDIE